MRDLLFDSLDVISTVGVIQVSFVTTITLLNDDFLLSFSKQHTTCNRWSFFRSIILGWGRVCVNKDENKESFVILVITRVEEVFFGQEEISS